MDFWNSPKDREKSGDSLCYSFWPLQQKFSALFVLSNVWCTNPFTCQFMCVLSRCLNDWMFSVSCWKIKMAKTLSAGLAKPESGSCFSQESSTAGEYLLKKMLLKKRSLQLLRFKAKTNKQTNKQAKNQPNNNKKTW